MPRPRNAELERNKTINLKVSEPEREIIRKAAKIDERGLTPFVRHHILEVAREILEQDVDSGQFVPPGLRAR